MEGEILLEYGDEERARCVGESVAVDDDAYVSVEVRGKTVIVRVSAETARGLMRAMDDVLACISTAERALGCLGALSSSSRR